MSKNIPKPKYSDVSAPWEVIREEYIFKDLSIRDVLKKYPGVTYHAVRKRALVDKWRELRATRTAELVDTVKRVSVDNIFEYSLMRDKDHQELAKQALGVAKAALSRIVVGMQNDKTGTFVDHLGLSRVMGALKDAMLLERVTLGLLTSTAKLEPNTDEKKKKQDILNDRELSKLAKSVGYEVKQLISLGVGETSNSAGQR